MADPNREKAKRVIVEIINKAGGSLIGSTRLYKAFYTAHLYYAEDAPGFLTDWPIVKMPNGPGIHEASSLIAELVREGILTEDRVTVGPYPARKYVATQKAQEFGSALDEVERESIKKAVDFIGDTTGKALSDWSHLQSRSWRMGSPGHQLNIYIDLIEDEDYEERAQSIEQLHDEFQAIFGAR